MSCFSLFFYPDKIFFLIVATSCLIEKTVERKKQCSGMSFGNPFPFDYSSAGLDRQKSNKIELLIVECQVFFSVIQGETSC